MANHGPSYGLSRELELKNAARFALPEAVEVLEWVQAATATPFPVAPARLTGEEELADLLRDGTRLCSLADALGAGPVQYTRNARMPFHMMENICQFLSAVKAFGVPEISLFQTVDLYEAKQVYKVVECLRALAAVAQRHGCPAPGWAVKLSSQAPRHFSREVLAQSNAVISLQMGSNRGASQKGMTPYGAGRQIVEPK